MSACNWPKAPVCARKEIKVNRKLKACFRDGNPTSVTKDTLTLLNRGLPLCTTLVSYASVAKNNRLGSKILIRILPSCSVRKFTVIQQM